MITSLALIASLLAPLSSFVQSQSTQDKKADRAQIVGTAEIIKIDEKKKILTVREIADSKTAPTTDEDTQRRCLKSRQALVFLDRRVCAPPAQ